MKKEIPTGPLFLFDQLLEGKIEEQPSMSLNELYNIYENEWCTNNLDCEGGKMYKKMKKREFHENIVSVFKFHSVLDATTPHDYDIWFETEMDHSGMNPVQTFQYFMATNHHQEMIARFRTTFGFLIPVD